MSTPETPATSPTWCGWARRGTRGKWQRLVSAVTDAEALEMVRQATASWQHVDLAVLPRGRDPNRGTGR